MIADPIRHLQANIQVCVKGGGGGWKGWLGSYWRYMKEGVCRLIITVNAGVNLITLECVL